MAQRLTDADLKKLVYAALVPYGLAVRKVRLLSAETNFLFHLSAEDSRQYALRVGAPGRRCLEETLAELEWLVAIARETAVRVAEPVPTRTGELLISLELSPSTPPVHCVLFNWVPGPSLADVPSEQRYFALGEAMARLHDHGTHFVQGRALRARRWRQVCSQSGGSAEHLVRCAGSILTATELADLVQALELAERAVRSVHDRLMFLPLVHGDLHPWNVKDTDEQLVLVDFDDVVFAHPAQDVAVVYFYAEKLAAFDRLDAAYRAGYRSVRSWPLASDAELRALVTAQRLSLMAQAVVSLDDPAPYLKGGTQRLQQFLGKGACV